MGILQDLQAQKADIEAKIAILQGVDEDTFNLHTVAQFSAASGSKWFYLKIGDEQWLRLTVISSSQGANTRQLREWIYEAKTSDVGYFEVYMMSPAANPFYASA